MQPELFHEIVDPGSARIRRWVVARGLEANVRFRNLSYPEVRADFDARGGTRAPALWDGEALASGADAVEARLTVLFPP